jgi:hypothetical protein
MILLKFGQVEVVQYYLRVINTQIRKSHVFIG